MQQGNTVELLCYRAFLLFKQMDANATGSGQIDIKMANKATKLFFGKNYTIHSLSRMKESEQFWSKSQTHIYITSWNKLWTTYEIVPSRFVVLPTSVFAKKSTFMAHIYTAWIDGRMIARDTIEELLSIPKTTQRRYERLCGTDVEAKGKILTESQVNDELFNNAAPPMAYKKITGTKDLYTRQLPNKYTTQGVHTVSCMLTTNFNKNREPYSWENNPFSSRNSRKVTYLTNRHTKFGNPLPKKFDGTKTLKESTTFHNNLSIMEPSGATYVYAN